MLLFCYISGSYHFTVRGIVSFIVHLTGIEPFMGDPTIFEGSYMTQNNFGNCFHNLRRDFSAVLLDGLSGNSETKSPEFEENGKFTLCLDLSGWANIKWIYLCTTSFPAFPSNEGGP